METAQYTPQDIIAQGRATGIQSAKRLLEIERLEKINAELVEALQWTESWIIKHGLDKAELITGQQGGVPILGTIRDAINKAKGE